MKQGREQFQRDLALDWLKNWTGCPAWLSSNGYGVVIGEHVL